MMPTVMSAVVSNDAELVGECLSGNRDAFGQIVARYQSLICSLAYSATGSLTQSEDLAQETFVNAWKQLPRLREPEKLRSWLCRIARNLIYDAVREQSREPCHHAGPVEEISGTHSPEPLPVDQTVSNEEAAILWRSLKKIPEIYREPLVLFYLEHQSVQAVAQNLDLSEDAVKQRLSRGRKLLHAEILELVEGALKKTSPGKTFTLGVLAAISLTTTTARAATVGTTVAKAGSATKLGASLGTTGAFLPVVGGFYFTLKSSLEHAKSPRERRFMASFFWIQLAVLLMLTALFGGWLSHSSFLPHPKMMWLVLPLALLACTFILGACAKYRRRQIQMEDGTWVKPMDHEQRKEYLANQRRHCSKAQVYLYLGLACCMVTDVIIELRQILNTGHGHFLFLGFLSVFTVFLLAQAWRSRPR